MSSTISNTVVESVVAAAPIAEKKTKKVKVAAEPAPVVESAAEAAPVVVEKEKKPRKPKTVAIEPEPEPEPVTAVAAEPADEASKKKQRKPKTVKDSAPAAAAEESTESAAPAAPVEEPSSSTEDEAAAKPRKPRVKKAAKAKAAEAATNLDAAALDSLDMPGKIALLKDHVLSLTQQVATLTARLESSAVSSDDESTSGKKQRKKREPKAKAVCPAASDGVVRFHATLKNDFKVLSNSHKADITIDGVVYPTVEHYFQCAKFISTAPEYAEKIRATSNPALIKNMGKTKKIEIRADWESAQMDVMRKALRAKFTQHADLATLLRSTGAARLEEESPSDAFWGIGADGAGANHLGVLLAEIRSSL